MMVKILSMTCGLDHFWACLLWCCVCICELENGGVDKDLLCVEEATLISSADDELRDGCGR